MRWILVAVVVMAGFYGWSRTGDRAMTREMAQLAARNPSGFVPVVMPANAPARTVWVFAPQNCPKDAAARAEKLDWDAAAIRAHAEQFSEARFLDGLRAEIRQLMEGRTA